MDGRRRLSDLHSLLTLGGGKSTSAAGCSCRLVRRRVGISKRLLIVRVVKIGNVKLAVDACTV